MSQDSVAVLWDLEGDGMQIGRHLILKYRDKPYVNAELFEDYLPSVLLPHLMITRIVKDLCEEDAVCYEWITVHFTSLWLSSNFSQLPVCAWL
jgi:hypothetical protein